MTLALDIAWERAAAAEKEATDLRTKLSIAKQEICRLQSQNEMFERELAFERGIVTTREYYAETQEETER